MQKGNKRTQDPEGRKLAPLTPKDTPTKGLDRAIRLLHPKHRTGECLRETAAKQAISEYVLGIIGEDEELDDLKTWLKATKNHGGTEEEWWKLYSIHNTENNLRAEQRKRMEL